MSRVLLTLFRYCRSFLAIYLCLIAGRGVSGLLPVTIPGSIIGMLLLFTLLATQILPVEWVRPGCQLIIRYMALLFVPISVGIMNDVDILSAQFAPIVVSCLVSTLIVLVTVGLLADRLQRKEGDDV